MNTFTEEDIARLLAHRYVSHLFDGPKGPPGDWVTHHVGATEIICIAHTFNIEPKLWDEIVQSIVSVRKEQGRL